jgi:uncharacterized protein GlcG (DUF336 family)
MSILSLAHASTIVDEALAEGRRRQFSPLCVVVLDAGAHAIALKREDRASHGRPVIATAKAAGCLSFGFGGREIARRAQSVPAFFDAVSGLLPQGLVPVPGGVLIRNAAGELLGAVGISGDTSDNDELCALAGIAAAGLVADSGAARTG